MEIENLTLSLPKNKLRDKLEVKQKIKVLNYQKVDFSFCKKIDFNATCHTFNTNSLIQELIENSWKFRNFHGEINSYIFY